MKLRHIRLALGGLLLMGALFVVLPGLGRFVAAPAAETPAERRCIPRLYSALLTSANRQTEETARQEVRGDMRLQAFAGMDAVPRALPADGALRDANGNVLTARVYYQCVPEAFAPGDAKT